MNNTTHLKSQAVMAAVLISFTFALSPSSMGSEPHQRTSTKTALSTTTAESLSLKQRAIPLMSSAATSGDMPRLNAALNNALNTGMTISEAKEILVQLYAYAGFPRSLNALNELMKVLEARRTQGVHDAPGNEPSRPPLVGDELLAKGTDNQTAIAGRRLEGPLFEFAPVINRFLRTHLFGDIFERDNLDWKSRELATVAALATLPGLDAQLGGHIRASINVGLSVEQLQEVADILSDAGSTDAATRFNDALHIYLAQVSK